MKVLITYSDTHKKLFQLFKKSYNIINANNRFVLIEDYCENQHGKGVYYDYGWNMMMQYKINSIRYQLSKLDENEIILYSDVDVIFLKDFSDEIEYRISQENLDLLCQEDILGGGTICAGFMAIRNNLLTRVFFDKVLVYLQGNACGDQYAINHYKNTIKYSFLDSRYCNVNHESNLNQIWEMNLPLPDLPHDAAIFHANWTLGAENKYEMMKCYQHEYQINVKT